MKIRILLSISILFISGCSGLSSSFNKLQGTWTAAGSIDEDHAWYLEYKFTGNKYKMQGYPPILEEGTMHLKETKGDSLLVEFRVTKSNPEYSNHSDWIYIKGNEFTLSSNTFRRSIDEKP